MKKLFIFLVLLISIFMFIIPIKADESLTKTCKYVNPFTNMDLDLVFTDTPETYYYMGGAYYSEKSEEKKMYLNSSKSYIKKFYVGRIQYISSSKYVLHTQGSYSMAGKNWIFDEDMTYNSIKFSDPCPELKYFTLSDKDGKEYVMISRGTSINCNEFNCNTIELYNNVHKSKVDTCSIDLTIPRLNKNLSFTFDSYSNGEIVWTASDGNTGVIDSSTGFKYQQLPNNPFSMGITATLNDMREIVSIDNNNKLNCRTAKICVQTYDETMGNYQFTLRPNSYNDDINCKVYNNTDVNEGGNGSRPNGGNNGNNGGISQPSGNVNSSCSAYLGVAGAGDNLASFLDDVWDVLKVGSILLVIVFSMFDLSKAVSNDKEKIPEVVKKSVLRLAFLVVVLLLPTLIEAIGSLAGVDNVLCGIK